MLILGTSHDSSKSLSNSTESKGKIITMMIIVMVVIIIFCFVCRYLSYLSALPYFYLKNIYLKTLFTFFFYFLKCNALLVSFYFEWLHHC